MRTACIYRSKKLYELMNKCIVKTFYRNWRAYKDFVLSHFKLIIFPQVLNMYGCLYSTCFQLYTTMQSNCFFLFFLLILQTMIWWRLWSHRKKRMQTWGKIFNSKKTLYVPSGRRNIWNREFNLFSCHIYNICTQHTCMPVLPIEFNSLSELEGEYMNTSSQHDIIHPWTTTSFSI